MSSILLPYATSFLSVCSMIMTIATFWRASKWKDQEEAKTLIAKVNRHENLLAAGEERFKGLATKEDLSGIRAEVHALDRTVQGVDAGVTRIEQFLINRGNKDD